MELIFVQAHCDSRVLHSPLHCKYCDLYPEAQDRRIAMKVNFTDTITPGFSPCPAIEARGYESLNRWGGNQPHGQNVTDEEIDYFEGIESFGSRVMYGETRERHAIDMA